jgi:hypothetical protein
MAVERLACTLRGATVVEPRLGGRQQRGLVVWRQIQHPAKYLADHSPALVGELGHQTRERAGGERRDRAGRSRRGGDRGQVQCARGVAQRPEGRAHSGTGAGTRAEDRHQRVDRATAQRGDAALTSGGELSDRGDPVLGQPVLDVRRVGSRSPSVVLDAASSQGHGDCRKIGDPAGTPHWPVRTDPPGANFHARAASSQGHGN